MGIVFDESEFLSLMENHDELSDDSPQNMKDKNGDAETENENELLHLYRRLTRDQQKKILTQVRHMLETVQSTKKLNLLKAIEESKLSVRDENLSDIIKDIVK